MALDPTLDFGTQLAALLANRFATLARARSQSRTISDTMFVLVDPSTTTGIVVASPYWAAYYHNGRGFVPRSGPKLSGVLVWFKDPKDDPRIPPGGVVRVEDTRRLTEEEFKAAKDAGLLIISRRAGPAPAHPFFLEAQADFEQEVDQLAGSALVEYLTSKMPNGAQPFVAPPAVVKLSF